jgi:hypothetical protein
MKKLVALLALCIVLGCNPPQSRLVGWYGTIISCEGDKCTIYPNATVIDVNQSNTLTFVTEKGEKVVCRDHWTLQKRTGNEAPKVR